MPDQKKKKGDNSSDALTFHRYMSFSQRMSSTPHRTSRKSEHRNVLEHDLSALDEESQFQHLPKIMSLGPNSRNQTQKSMKMFKTESRGFTMNTGPSDTTPKVQTEIMTPVTENRLMPLKKPYIDKVQFIGIPKKKPEYELQDYIKMFDRVDTQQRQEWLAKNSSFRSSNGFSKSP